jgi:hypothetical protein
LAIVFLIIGWLAVSLALIIPTNKLAQRFLPTRESDSDVRRYVYGLLVKIIGISIFLFVGGVIMCSSILLGFARWPWSGMLRTVRAGVLAVPVACGAAAASGQERRGAD